MSSGVPEPVLHESRMAAGDLSRAVFVDIILVDAAVLIGERRGEVRGVGRRDGIARAELDPASVSRLLTVA